MVYIEQKERQLTFLLTICCNFAPKKQQSVNQNKEKDEKD